MNLAGVSPDGQFLFTNSMRWARDRQLMQNSNDVSDAQTPGNSCTGRSRRQSIHRSRFSPDARTMYLGGHSQDWPEGGR